MILAIFLSIGCDSLWDIANRSALKREVRTLLENNGIEDPSFVSCHMLGSTRVATCELVLAKQQVVDLVRALELEPLDREDWENGELWWVSSSKVGSCLDEPDDLEAFQVWGLAGLHDQFRIDEGTAFTDVVLSYWPAESFVCLQVTYSYG